MVGPVFEHPLSHGVVLFDLCRVLRFRRPVVNGKNSSRVGTHREFTKEPVVGLVVTENPSGTVDAEDDRQWTGGTSGG